MATAKLTAAILFLLISAQAGNGVDDEQQQQCSVDNLPEFGDIYTTSTDRPSRDRFQAIVPAYTFNCTGRVTEWRACLHPGATTNEMYYIQFQVWRPTGIEGCYELVDYNIPLDHAGQEEMNVSDSNVIIEAEGSLSPPGDNGPLHRCVVLPVRESQQIDVQPGDVVGFYVDHFFMENDLGGGGIQWIESTEVKIFYRDNFPRVQIKDQYALFPIEPSACGFQIANETSDLHSLSQTASSAPIITLLFPTVMVTSTVAPPGPVETSSTLTTTSVTLSYSMTIIELEMSPSVPPPATPPSVSQDDYTASIVGSVLAITIAAIVTTVVISVLVCLRKRKKESELVDNVAYHTQNTELKANPNSAYNAVSTAIPTTTNEAYAATHIPTSPNTAYEVVQPTADDIDTKTNEAYVATGIATSANEAYQLVQSTSDNTEVYDYARPQ